MEEENRNVENKKVKKKKKEFKLYTYIANYTLKTSMLPQHPCAFFLL